MFYRRAPVQTTTSRGLPARGRGSQHTPTLAHTTVTNLYGLTLALTVCVFIRQIMNRMCCTEKCVSSLRRGNAGSRQDPETGQQNGSHGEQTAEKNGHSDTGRCGRAAACRWRHQDLPSRGHEHVARCVIPRTSAYSDGDVQLVRHILHKILYVA